MKSQFEGILLVKDFWPSPVGGPTLGLGVSVKGKMGIRLTILGKDGKPSSTYEKVPPNQLSTNGRGSTNKLEAADMWKKVNILG